MFEQHPVPQQISSYEFRLVGDMTLKQFFQLAGGALVGILVYASPLPTIFKWPIIIFSVLSGAAFAFLPLQERPLTEWVSAFFRSIYGPTLFVWTGSKKVDYFAPEEGIVEETGRPNEPLTKAEQVQETVFVRIMSMLTPGGGAGDKAVVTNPAPAVQTTPMAPLKVAQPVVPTPSYTISSIEPLEQRTAPAPTVAQPKAGTIGVFTPTNTAPQVENKGFAMPPKVSATPQPVAQAGTPLQEVVKPTVSPAAVNAQFSPDAAPPLPPEYPNIIVGQVMDKTSKIIEGAIIEIRDLDGRPLRALRTNRAGHFMIVTPLSLGQYKITIEKEGLIFDPLNLEVKGAIIPPIAIRARNESVGTSPTPAQAF